MTAAMVDTKPAEKTAEKPKVVPLYRLTPNRLKPADYESRRHVVYPEHGTPFEALLQPDYWTHIAAKLRAYDDIEARAEDGSWIAHLKVLDAGTLHATVFPLNKWDLVQIDRDHAPSSGFEPKWRGPHAKWAVMRLADNKDMIKDLATRQAAEEWIANYRKTPGL